MGGSPTLEGCTAIVVASTKCPDGNGYFRYNQNPSAGYCACCKNAKGVEDGSDLIDDGYSVYKIDTCTTITPKTESPPTKTIFSENISIEPEELFDGFESNCKILIKCMLQNRNTQGTATGFNDFTASAGVRNGISVADFGKVTIDHETFIVLGGEEFRVSCDEGAKVSPAFKVIKNCPISARATVDDIKVFSDMTFGPEKWFIGITDQCVPK